MGVEWFGLVMGLGFVLSFGYWCTDFLVVQRAMAAESMSAARRTPLIAAVPKMLFPFLVILPGMIAIALPTPGIPAAAADARSVGRRRAESAGKGIIPPRSTRRPAQLKLDKNGKPVARLRPGHADDADALLPDRPARAWG